jgi:hypothetical protein
MFNPDGPKIYVGGNFCDEAVFLRCGRCDRKGRLSTLGVGMTWNSEFHFSTTTKIDKQNHVWGKVEFAESFLHPSKGDLIWYAVPMDGGGLTFRCTACRSRPIVNAIDLTNIATGSVLLCADVGFGFDVLIDPFGGTSIGQTVDGRDSPGSALFE